jgi:membrane-associated PAP2 superfamily phosphatase
MLNPIVIGVVLLLLGAFVFTQSRASSRGVAFLLLVVGAMLLSAAIVGLL